MTELFQRLLNYLDSPVVLVLCIGIIYMTRVVSSKEDKIKEKDNYIKELAKQTYDGVNALTKLTDLLESLIRRGGDR